MASASSTPSWRLISVLLSTIPLTPALAGTLHQAALELLRRNAGVTPVAGDLVQGRVVNLKKDLLLGTIGGPAFEAELETERGSGKVRFLLTREGLEAEQLPAPPSPRRRPLLN
ncbi:hypothetical protein [Anaeromyxobacter diazotrophicus]|uniref:hypothetical protein n=1 Tax=Anaeromyxobacter diazotrophicus TaxID=2590199 RepID=UPI0015911A98|nr:hypothetical protein [Anaeromyxobacter diazotrophicus]